jgi:hypothetical protein
MPNPKPDPPPEPAHHAPRTTAEAADLLRDLKARRTSFQDQLDAVTKSQFALAAQYTLNDPQAVAEMESLDEIEGKILQHLRLSDAAIGQAEVLLKVLEQREAQERETERRKSYEALLLQSLAESRHADAALSEVARHLRARGQLLLEAQALAETATELGQLKQLRSQQAVTWACGHAELLQHLDPRMFPYPTHFASLADYTSPRLPGYGLNPDAEPAPNPPAAQEVPHADKQRVQ